MFDTSVSQQPVANGTNWIAELLLGEVAVTLCVLAVAFVGLSMLTGRISVRRGGQVILGCFLLLGAPTIAGNMLSIRAPGGGDFNAPAETVVYEAQPREPLPEATYNPYAGASLRRSSAN